MPHGKVITFSDSLERSKTESEIAPPKIMYVSKSRKHVLIFKSHFKVKLESLPSFPPYQKPRRRVRIDGSAPDAGSSYRCATVRLGAAPCAGEKRGSLPGATCATSEREVLFPAQRGWLFAGSQAGEGGASRSLQLRSVFRAVQAKSRHPAGTAGLGASGVQPGGRGTTALAAEEPVSAAGSRRRSRAFPRGPARLGPTR